MALQSKTITVFDISDFLSSEHIEDCAEYLDLSFGDAAGTLVRPTLVIDYLVDYRDATTIDRRIVIDTLYRAVMTGADVFVRFPG